MTLSRWESIRRRFFKRAPRYETDFEKTPDGNGLRFGSPLKVRVKDAEVVTGRVFDKLTKRTYQINQSHVNDEDKDVETILFTLMSSQHPDAVAPNYYLPKGDYILLTWWWDNDTMRGGTYKDEFLIY